MKCKSRPPTKRVELFGAAADLQLSTATAALIEGPSGTGKTLAVWHRLLRYCIKHPGIRCLAVRKVRVSMNESVLVTFEQDVLDEANRVWLRCYECGRASRHTYDFPNKSSIVVGGMDQPTRIGSTDFDVIAVFEATELTEDDFGWLTSRMGRGRKFPCQMICDCNPSGPAHWLNLTFERPGVDRLRSIHEDNPQLYDHARKRWTRAGAEYLKRLDTLPGHLYERLRLGKWAAASGLIYPAFRRDLHCVVASNVPTIRRRFWACDFGAVHPFVAQLWGLDNDGRRYRLREIYETADVVPGRKTLIDDHAAIMKTLCPPEECEAAVCDHAAQERMILERAGYRVLDADKSDVLAGLNRCRSALEPGPDGRPRCYFVEDALYRRDESLAQAKRPWCTEQEFDTYVHAKDREGRSKEEPIKMFDDGMDAWRYGEGYAAIGEPGEPLLAKSSRVFLQSRGSGLKGLW